MGEVIASLRQYSKRFSFLSRAVINAITPTATLPGSTGNGLVIFPWAPVIPNNGAITVSATGAQSPTYDNQYNISTTSPATTIFQYVDIFSQLYSMYAFFRGSVRYKVTVSRPGANYSATMPVYIYINNVVNPDSGNWSPNMGITPSINSGAATNLGTGPIQPLYDIAPVTATTLKTGFAYQPGLAEARMVVYPNLEGMIEFEVPFHASGPFCPTNYGQNNPTNARSLFYPFPTVTITGTQSAVGATGHTLTGCTLDVFRACGDDFSFGGLLGSPQHSIWYSAINPT